MAVTPLFSCATLRARSFKFMPRWSRQEQHGVRKDSLPFTTIFISEFQYSFCFFPTFAFCSFTLWISPNFYVSPRCFLAFKMGVKNVRHFMIVWFFTEPLYRSALHDSLFRPSRFIVRHFTIVYFDRAILSFSTSQ